jgi:hypothetical protein
MPPGITFEGEGIELVEVVGLAVTVTVGLTATAGDEEGTVEAFA